jgi:hypothetical protein
MRILRNLSLLLVAYLSIPALHQAASAQFCTATALSTCRTDCSGDAVPPCSTLCAQQCGSGYTSSSQSDQCGDGSGCSSGSFHYQRSCSCQPPPPSCYDDWWGCATSSQCCHNNCNTQTWLCGVNCAQQCGGSTGDSLDCYCSCTGGTPDYAAQNCGGSPILINMSNNGSDHLTSAADGVFFDIFANGTPIRVAWTSADSPVGFLVWDRNRNGTIDDGSELFGSVTRLRNGHMAANGFEALAEWDVNHDRRIDSSDPVYSKLRLWFDLNHNGFSEPDELLSLESVGVLSVETDYRDTHRQDQNGNLYRYEGTAVLRQNRERVVRRIFDVLFKTMQ